MHRFGPHSGLPSAISFVNKVVDKIAPAFGLRWLLQSRRSCCHAPLHFFSFSQGPISQPAAGIPHLPKMAKISIAPPGVTCIARRCDPDRPEQSAVLNLQALCQGDQSIVDGITTANSTALFSSAIAASNIVTEFSRLVLLFLLTKRSTEYSGSSWKKADHPRNLRQLGHTRLQEWRPIPPDSSASVAGNTCWKYGIRQPQ